MRSGVKQSVISIILQLWRSGEWITHAHLIDLSVFHVAVHGPSVLTEAPMADVFSRSCPDRRMKEGGPEITVASVLVC